MDLKSIINADSSNSASSRPPPPPAPKQQHTQSYQNYHHQQSPGPHNVPQQYGGRFNGRPPQPPPIRPPSHHTASSPSGSMSYQPLQSPYGTTPSTASVSGNQYPFSPADPQSRPLSTQSNNSQYSQRTATGPPPVTQVYGHASPAPVTPTGERSINAYGYPQYQQTPSSQPSYAPLPAQSHVQAYTRDSYQGSHNQNVAQRQAYPPMAQQSQPATPLGPPPTLSRANTMRREGSISYAYDHQRTQSGSSYGHSPKSGQSSATLERNGSIPLAASPRGSISRGPPTQSHSYVGEGFRERSLSVSPKTRLNPEISHVGMSMGRNQEQQRQWSKPMDLEQVSPPDHNLYKENRQLQSTQYAQSQPPPRNNTTELNGMNVYPPIGHYDAEQAQYQKYETVPNQIPERLNEWSTSLKFLSHQDRPDATILNTQDAPSSRAAHLQSSTPQERPFDQTPISHVSPTPPTTAHSTSSLGPPAPQTPSSSHRPIMISELSNSSTRHTSVPHPPSLKKEFSTPSAPSTPTAKTPTASSSHMKKQEHSPRSITPSDQHPRKKARMDDIPIWAQKATRGNGNPQRPRQITYRNSSQSQASRSRSSITPIPPQAPPKTTTNGHNPSKLQQQQQPAVPTAQPTLGNNGPFGPLEDSIINVQPFEELTRAISDFLFHEVVIRSDFGSTSANGTPIGPAVLEIEAKLGQLIDSNTGLRLNLPVLTETILDVPSFSNQRGGRINFKSSMTESQHRSFNGYLNNCVKESHPAKPPPNHQQQPHHSAKPRIPVTYKHTKERDTFYDLPAANEALFPASVLHLLRHKPKIRITTAKHDGSLLAKIIKCRLADIDVYSPRTRFDWRVSVNMEMSWEGDVGELVERTGDGGNNGNGGGGGGGVPLRSREKDRMTYKHCGAYQIDLTQVTPADATSHADKEHELEIEVDAAALRRQGRLLQAEMPNQYADLVRGFVDNVRLLARHCKE